MSETQSAQEVLKEHAELRDTVRRFDETDLPSIKQAAETFATRLDAIEEAQKKQRQSFTASGITRKTDLFVNVPETYSRDANSAMTYLMRCKPQTPTGDLARFHALHDRFAFLFAYKNGVDKSDHTKTVRRAEVSEKVRYSPEWQEYAALREQFMPKNLIEHAAMDRATATEGLEWVPLEIFSTTMIDLIRDSSQLSSLFIQRDLPGSKLTMPRKTANPTTYLVAESTDNTGSLYNTPTTSGIGTAQFSYVAIKLMAEAPVSNELMEDSPVMGAEMGRDSMIQAFGDSISEVILDGDTETTHQDSDSDTAGDRRKAWLGLRAAAVDGNGTAAYSTDMSNTITVSKIIDARGGMGNHSGWIGARGGNVLVLGPLAYAKLLQDSNLLTFNAVGAGSPNITGNLTTIGGVPTFVSNKVRENLNASGLYDGSTTDQTYGMLVDTAAWGLGTRIDLQVRISDIIYARGDLTTFIGRWRGDFKSEYGTFGAAGAPKSVWYLFNAT